MEIIFSIDKERQTEHFKVKHPEVSKNDIFQVFENTYLEFTGEKHIRQVIGHNNEKKFFIVIWVKNKTKTCVITAYRAKRNHIIFWNKEVNKND